MDVSYHGKYSLYRKFVYCDIVWMIVGSSDDYISYYIKTISDHISTRNLIPFMELSTKPNDLNALMSICI